MTEQDRSGSASPLRGECGWCGEVADFLPHETNLAVIVCQACGGGTYLPSKAHLAAIDRAASEGRFNVSGEDIERERERLRGNDSA